MAAAHPAAAAALSISLNCPTASQHYHLLPTPQISVRPPASISLSGFLGSCIDRNLVCPSNRFERSRSAFWIPAVSQIVVDGSVNSIATDGSKLEVNSAENEATSQVPTQEEAPLPFMTDIANLVRLVDSRDIVELELKHLDFEISIRKKEALPSDFSPPQSFPPPQFIAHAPFPAYPAPPPPATHAASSQAPAALSSTASPAASTSAPATPAADHPRMLSPMAGTFYKSPAPGDPAFIKVGDKVQKGQVICIVEAMKLMNEIEADQTGRIVDILVEDGKSVSVDTPLFIIEP